MKLFIVNVLELPILIYILKGQFEHAIKTHWNRKSRSFVSAFSARCVFTRKLGQSYKISKDNISYPEINKKITALAYSRQTQKFFIGKIV